MYVTSVIKRGIEHLENIKFLNAIRDGMVSAIPIVLIGCFASLLMNFPIQQYQILIHQCCGGVAVFIFKSLQTATSRFLVLYLLLTVSQNYERLLEFKTKGILQLICISSFLAFNIDHDGKFDPELFSSSRLLICFFIILVAARLYLICDRYKFLQIKPLYSEGADTVFNSAMTAIVPTVIITSFFACVKIIILKLTGIYDISDAILTFLMHFFIGGHSKILSAVLFILLSQILWFFGIHPILLNTIANTLFIPGMAPDTVLTTQLLSISENLSASFIFTFVTIGGAGAGLCLLAAVLLFDKRRNMRNLATLASSQVLFNISDLLLFGLPIILNPVMLIPFIIVPAIFTGISYIAIYTGLVPNPIYYINWMTPVFFSGYLATNSIMGILLQLFNLTLGILIYAPFVRLSSKQYFNSVQQNIDTLTKIVKKAETEGIAPNLYKLRGPLGSVCKMLTSELKQDIKAGTLELYYQPQVTYYGKVTGFEALLRWFVKDYGLVYPPLTITLAEEAGIMVELGDFITNKACTAIEFFNQQTDRDICISVNYSAIQVADPNLGGRVEKILARHSLGNSRLGIEITEQSFLASSTTVSIQLQALRELRIEIKLDDFGMGHSSLLYLQKNHFDELKLDGSLVKEIENNSRSRNIISSIVHLSKSLGFTVLAEFVDNTEQREILHELGCDCYQGYYYSPAVPLAQAIKYYLQNYKIPSH